MEFICLILSKHFDRKIVVSFGFMTLDFLTLFLIQNNSRRDQFRIKSVVYCVDTSPVLFFNLFSVNLKRNALMI